MCLSTLAYFTLEHMIHPESPRLVILISASHITAHNSSVAQILVEAGNG